ncbi:ribonuclease III [bacterium]|nr:ribonuclease III [bacterium]
MNSMSGNRIIRRLRLFIGGRRESGRSDSLSAALRYTFRDPRLLQRALRHRSMTGEQGESWESNERLEFLGDAVLGLVVTERLYQQFPTHDEGDLTIRKSFLVCRETLAAAARRLRLGTHVILSQGEESSGGRYRDSILANTFEAVVGAIYLDGGLAKAAAFIETFLISTTQKPFNKKFYSNYKSRLLEFAQSRGLEGPRYEVIDTTGPDHEKIFTVQVSIDGNPVGSGCGRTKKKAEQAAARAALEQVNR